MYILVATPVFIFHFMLWIGQEMVGFVIGNQFKMKKAENISFLFSFYVLIYGAEIFKESCSQPCVITKTIISL